jgi:trehalose 6-phosphate phosphatase
MYPVSGRSGQLATLLAPLRSDPSRTGIFTDVDGTLAPIAPRPGEAAVPEEARELLASLAARYALVGCISGRRASAVMQMVGLPELCYVGNHGFERLLPGESEPRPNPALYGHEGAAADFLAHFDAAELETAGLRLEDKGPIKSLHWRGAPDEAAAEERAREVAREAVGRGLVAHWGRKVLEIRPAVDVDKGTAIAELLQERRMAHGLYAGDDRTDVDAFERLRDLRRAGDLGSAVCVGVASPESPPEVSEEADLVVEGPAGFLAVLRLLA